MEASTWTLPRTSTLLRSLRLSLLLQQAPTHSFGGPGNTRFRTLLFLFPKDIKHSKPHFRAHVPNLRLACLPALPNLTEPHWCLSCEYSNRSEPVWLPEASREACPPLPYCCSGTAVPRTSFLYPLPFLLENTLAFSSGAADPILSIQHLASGIPPSHCTTPTALHHRTTLSPFDDPSLLAAFVGAPQPPVQRSHSPRRGLRLFGICMHFIISPRTRSFEQSKGLHMPPMIRQFVLSW